MQASTSNRPPPFPPDVIRLNLLMLIAPLHRNCGKLLNDEIFVAQVYFVTFNARRVAVTEYALHFLPGPLRAISRYARFSQARIVKHAFFEHYIVAQNPRLSQNLICIMNEELA